MTEIIDMDIPTNALTTCPLQRFGFVSIGAVCIKCPHFGGLIDVGAPVGEAFLVRYRVKCNVPRTLEIIEVNLG